MTTPQPTHVSLPPFHILLRTRDALADQQPLFLMLALLTAVANLVPLFGSLVLCGYTYCVVRKFRGEQVRWGDFGFGFRHAGPVLTATLTMYGIALSMGFASIMIASFIARLGIGNEADGTSVWDNQFTPLFFLLGQFFCLTRFQCAFAVLAISPHSGLEALRHSVQAASRNPGGVVAVTVMQLAALLVALLACLLPAILMLPIVLGMSATLMVHIFLPELVPEEEDEEGEEGDDRSWEADEPSPSDDISAED